MPEDLLYLLMKNDREGVHHTSVEEILLLHHIINATIFRNRLSTPTIKVSNYCRKYWGYFEGEKHSGKIVLHNKWKNIQFLITILTHEMIHQYQWEVIGPHEKNLTHGKSFFAFRGIMKHFSIPLHRKYSIRKYSVNPKVIRKLEKDKYKNARPN